MTCWLDKWIWMLRKTKRGEWRQLRAGCCCCFWKADRLLTDLAMTRCFLFSSDPRMQAWRAWQAKNHVILASARNAIRVFPIVVSALHTRRPSRTPPPLSKMKISNLPPTSSLTALSSSPLRSSQSAKELDIPIDSSGHLPSYRAVRPLPYELREHCMIYFEEGLHCQALNLLTTLLTSGFASPSPLPAFLPPPQYIALIATLAVHPTLSTRAKTLDRIQAGNLALRYLRLLLKHAGPVNGNLNEAFSFKSLNTSSRRGGAGRKRTTDEGIDLHTNGSECVDTELAKAGSLWARAEDFWQVVGWCFNCSILHKRRWERWSAWLRYMLEVLEADWDTREQGEGDGSREKSLVMKYINSAMTATGRQRKILRAIFADGRTKSVAELGEIWQNETKELKKETDIKKVDRKIDIEADDYGDYMEDEDDEDLEDSPEEASSSAEEVTDQPRDSIPNVAEDLGGMDSVNLRLRLLSLLSKVSAVLPTDFTDLNTLYDNFLEHFRTLPLPAFFLVISPTTLRAFTPAAASSLAGYILRSTTYPKISSRRAIYLMPRTRAASRITRG